ncbi:hypothetical protein PILCRDRAFT_825163 [Piloderma croceum F 1598]|uniref:Uncharacterized protein n=1 Tax=Piloderma croceum (strain F 1598) TaxID=765440 RepID=A0A0C3FDB3_PILCF|nr:hypothetical protein PILCRDRAFT_825163 [Piloderma croceum F 1598]
MYGDYAPDFRSNFRDTPPPRLLLASTSDTDKRCSAAQLMGDSRHLSFVDFQEEATHILCGLGHSTYL